MTATQPEQPTEHAPRVEPRSVPAADAATLNGAASDAGSLEDTINAVAAVFADASSEAKPYVAVAVTDNDDASLIGAYSARSVAQAQASRASGDRTGAWIRAYVAAPATDGGCVVLSGNLVIGRPVSN